MFGIFWGTPTNMERWKNDHSWLKLPFDQGCWSPNSFRSWFVHPYPNAASPVASWKRGSHPSWAMETWGHRSQDRMPECNFVTVHSVVGILDPQFLLGYRVPNPKCSNGSWILHWILWSKNFHTQHPQKHVRVAPDQHTRTMPIPQTPCPMSLSGEDCPGPTGITNVTSILIFGARIYPTLTQDHASMFQQFIDFV